MPYCPECHDEFEDWVKVCPDCGVALVDEMPTQFTPPDPATRDESVVYLATAPNEAVAAMWSGILAEHGIQSMFKRGHLATMGYALTGQHCQLHVLRSEAERASQILAPFTEDGASRSAETEDWVRPVLATLLAMWQRLLRGWRILR